jgi:hypothetical protein
VAPAAARQIASKARLHPTETRQNFVVSSQRSKMVFNVVLGELATSKAFALVALIENAPAKIQM